jgi:hypothetical protein
MTRFLEVKKFLGLKKLLKIKDPPQNKTQTKKKQKIKNKKFKCKTYLPLAFLPLLSCCLLMLVFYRHYFASFVPKSDCFHMSHRVKEI